ncbi:MAG: hypothetical protein JO113_07995 [Candidatus Eremiobacteraeota bacterium]|nr:hypothetical protein [Candidatus Eremiobacteraeota bacterium]
MQSRPAAQPAGVPRVFVIGANASTLAVINSLRNDPITAQLVPLAWTPTGIALGTQRQGVGIARAGLLDWIDRTFPPDDERAFVASVRDLELLIRIDWESPFPEKLDDDSVINVDDLPDEIAEGLAQPAAALVACAACRRLCVRDDFLWKEKQLCAWDYHAQVFGKRGPWREGPYEARHFETLPSCAYVAADLLRERNVEILLTLQELPEMPIDKIVNALLQSDSAYPHMAVRTQSGIAVLREK